MISIFTGICFVVAGYWLYRRLDVRHKSLIATYTIAMSLIATYTIAMAIICGIFAICVRGM